MKAKVKVKWKVNEVTCVKRKNQILFFGVQIWGVKSG